MFFASQVALLALQRKAATPAPGASRHWVALRVRHSDDSGCGSGAGAGEALMQQDSFIVLADSVGSAGTQQGRSLMTAGAAVAGAQPLGEATSQGDLDCSAGSSTATSDEEQRPPAGVSLARTVSLFAARGRIVLPQHSEGFGNPKSLGPRQPLQPRSLAGSRGEAGEGGAVGGSDTAESQGSNSLGEPRERLAKGRESSPQGHGGSPGLADPGNRWSGTTVGASPERLLQLVGAAEAAEAQEAASSQLLGGNSSLSPLR